MGIKSNKNGIFLLKKAIAAITIAAFLFSLVPVDSVFALRPAQKFEQKQPDAQARAAGDWAEFLPEAELTAHNIALLEARTTPEKVRSNIEVRQRPNPSAIPQGEEAISTSLPDDLEVVDLSQGADPQQRQDYIAEGANVDALARLGVVIAAGGEGSRLMIQLWQEGKITEQERDELNKFSIPFAPDGVGTIQQDLLVLSFISRKFGIDIPVLVVANIETEERIKNLLRANNMFGLKSIAVTGQDMEATLVNGEDRIAVDSDGNSAFNPNGGAGVLMALDKDISVLDSRGSEYEYSMNGFSWFNQNFRINGIKDGRVVFLQSDMEVLPEQIFALAAAAKDHDVVAVSYPYPTDLNDDGQHKYTYGTFIKIGTQDGRGVEHERMTIVEYANRQDYPGLVELIRQIESEGRFAQANAGLFAFSLDFLGEALPKIPQRIQRSKNSMGVEGKVDKPEYFIPDLLCYAQSPVVVEMDSSALQPVKDWDRLASKRQERLKEALDLLRENGIIAEGAPSVQFCASFAYALRQGHISLSGPARISGAVGVKFDEDAIRVYTLKQRGESDPFKVFDNLIQVISYIYSQDEVFALPQLNISEAEAQATGETKLVSLDALADLVQPALAGKQQFVVFIDLDRMASIDSQSEIDEKVSSMIAQILLETDNIYIVFITGRDRAQIRKRIIRPLMLRDHPELTFDAAANVPKDLKGHFLACSENGAFLLRSRAPSAEELRSAADKIFQILSEEKIEINQANVIFLREEEKIALDFDKNYIVMREGAGIQVVLYEELKKLGQKELDILRAKLLRKFNNAGFGFPSLSAGRATISMSPISKASAQEEVMNRLLKHLGLGKESVGVIGLDDEYMIGSGGRPLLEGAIQLGGIAISPAGPEVSMEDAPRGSILVQAGGPDVAACALKIVYDHVRGLQEEAIQARAEKGFAVVIEPDEAMRNDIVTRLSIGFRFQGVVGTADAAQALREIKRIINENGIITLVVNNTFKNLTRAIKENSPQAAVVIISDPLRTEEIVRHNL